MDALTSLNTRRAESFHPFSKKLKKKKKKNQNAEVVASPDNGVQSLDKAFKIDYTTNRKGADEQCLVSFPFLVDQKRLTVRFGETEAVNLLCFYRSSREKSSSQHQMRLSQR